VTLSDRVTVYGSGGRWKPFRIVCIYRQVKALIEGGTCDVISTQDPYYIGLVGYFLARWFHAGFEAQVHGLYALSWMRILLARFVLARAGSLRVASARLQRTLRAYPFGIDRDAHTHVIPTYVDVSTLGFDPETLSATARTAREKERATFKDTYADRFNFLTVSRLIPVKHISLQLAALDTLRHESPEVMLHVVGDGPARAALDAEVTRRGLQEHVVFHGTKRHEALGAFFCGADCFVLTSDTEGWGMAAIEAALAGLPVIMTDVGCAGEVIRDGEEGIVISVGDTEALIASMRRIVHDPALRAQLADNARTVHTRLDSFETIARRCVHSWTHALIHRF